MLSNTTTRRWPENRLKELREARRMTQKELAEASGISFQQIGNIERGERRLDTRSAGILGRALDCHPSEFFPDAPATVPVRLVVASAFAERGPLVHDLAPPHERVQVRQSVPHPERCIAALVNDDSADRLYPPNSIVVAREIEPGMRVPVGAKVIVRHYRRDRAHGETMEVLVGILDVAAFGDLQVQLRTRNRSLPASVTIQTPPRYGSGLSERHAAMLAKPDSVEWEPRPDDRADIVGRIVLAITPEE